FTSPRASSSTCAKTGAAARSVSAMTATVAFMRPLNDVVSAFRRTCMGRLKPATTYERRLRIRARYPRPAVAGRRARHNAPVGQRHAPRVNQVRAVSRQIAVDDQRVAELDVALLPASARERAGPAAFARPFGDVA